MDTSFGLNACPSRWLTATKGLFKNDAIEHKNTIDELFNDGITQKFNEDTQVIVSELLNNIIDEISTNNIEHFEIEKTEEIVNNF